MRVLIAIAAAAWLLISLHLATKADCGDDIACQVRMESPS